MDFSIFDKKEINMAFDICNETYNCFAEYGEKTTTLKDKISALEWYYTDQPFEKPILKTKNGVVKFEMPVDYLANMYVTSISNCMVEEIDETFFGTKKIKLTKNDASKIGLIIVENDMDDSMPGLIIVE